MPELSDAFKKLVYLERKLNERAMAGQMDVMFLSVLLSGLSDFQVRVEAVELVKKIISRTLAENGGSLEQAARKLKIDPEQLEGYIKRLGANASDLQNDADSIERNLISDALKRAEKDVRKAAKLLGVHVDVLRDRIKHLGL